MVVEKSNSYGISTNGTWDGMRGHLQRGVSDLIPFIIIVIEQTILLNVTKQIKILNQDIDIACAAFVGLADHDILELSAYLLGDGYCILGKYPTPKIAIYGIAKTFSPSV